MNRSIQLLVFVFAIGLALLSAFVIAVSWICLVVSVGTKRCRAPVPLVLPDPATSAPATPATHAESAEGAKEPAP